MRYRRLLASSDHKAESQLVAKVVAGEATETSTLGTSSTR